MIPNLILKNKKLVGEVMAVLKNTQNIIMAV